MGTCKTTTNEDENDRQIDSNDVPNDNNETALKKIERKDVIEYTYTELMELRLSILQEKFGEDIASVVMLYIQFNPRLILDETLIIEYVITMSKRSCCEIHFNRTEHISQLNNKINRECKTFMDESFECIVELSGHCSGTRFTYQQCKATITSIMLPFCTKYLRQLYDQQYKSGDYQTDLKECISIELSDFDPSVDTTNIPAKFVITQLSLRWFLQNGSYGPRLYRIDNDGHHINIIFRSK